MRVLYLVLALMPVFITCDESCKRPAELLEFEEACKTDPEVTGNSGTFLEQLEENIASVVDQTKRLINIAKKKLGIKYDEEPTDEQTKKCEYYQCILRKMEILSPNNYPNMTLMEHWITEKVDDSLKESTTMKMKSCFNALAMNIAISEFSINILQGEDDKTDLKIAISKTDQDGVGIPDESPVNQATSCEAALKLLMCLTMDEKCSMFKFP